MALDKVKELSEKLQKAIEQSLQTGLSRFENLTFTSMSDISAIIPDRLGIFVEYNRFIIVEQFDPHKPPKSSPLGGMCSSVKSDERQCHGGTPQTSTPRSVLKESVTFRETINSCNSNATDIGSPLKMVEIADFSDYSRVDVLESKKQSVSSLYTPVSSKEARRLLSLVSLARAQIGDCELGLSCPLIVLCDGKETGRTAFMSYEIIPGERMGQNITTATIKGPVLLNEIEKMNFGKVAGITKCYALHNIVKSLSSDCPFADLKGSLQVELEWNKSTKFLSPPINKVDADVIAIVVPPVGDSKSKLHTLYEELNLIKRLVMAIETGEMVWGCHVVDGESNVMEELTKCFNNLKNSDSYVESKKRGTESRSELLSVSKRRDYDFSDLLWNILANCSSYSDLDQAFRMVFKLLKSREYQPLVNVHNSTRMASIIKKSFDDCFFVPDFLSRSQTFEVLIDMGMHKLIYDYVSVLISNGMATLHALKPFLDSDLSFKSRLVKLQRLHNMLEVICQLDMYLHIPHTTVERCVRDIIRIFENNDGDSVIHEFQVKIPLSDVKMMLEKSWPYIWSSSLVSNAKGIKDNTVMYFCQDCPVAYIEKDKCSTKNHDVNEYVVLSVKQSVRC